MKVIKHQYSEGMDVKAKIGFDGHLHITWSEKATWSNFSPKNASHKAVAIEEIDSEEQYRNLGSTLGWGLAAGVLTGGVGLLLGAAWGARKRGHVLYVVTLSDETKAIIEVTTPKEIRAVKKISVMQSIPS
jgi:hypothetical protein